MPRLTAGTRSLLWDAHSAKANAKSIDIAGLVQNEVDLTEKDYNMLCREADIIVNPWVIQCGYAGNALLFWKERNAGYTTDYARVGLYTEAEAKKQADQRTEDTAWPMSALESGIQVTINSELISDYGAQYRGK